MPTANVATFVIPCYEAGAYLRPLLESLLAQTRQDFALVLVDDASTDGSAELAREVAGERLVVHRNERRLGIGANWNRCAEFVETPFFCLAHMDDVYEPTYLERMIAALEADPGAGLAHCPQRPMAADGSLLDSPAERFKARMRARAGRGSPARQFEVLIQGNYVGCPTVLYRREAFAAVGPFRVDYRFVLDWDHHLRMLLSGRSLRTVPEPLVRWRRHDTVATLDSIRSLDRYREEAELIRTFTRGAVERGWLRPGSRPSRALRNNLIFDAWTDLSRGDEDGFRRKLRYAREDAPDLAWDPATRMFAASTRCGALGRLAIRAALRLVAGSALQRWGRLSGAGGGRRKRRSAPNRPR